MPPNGQAAAPAGQSPPEPTHSTSVPEPGGVSPQADLLVERLLRVIDEGRRTATYKLASLAGLIDAVALTSGAPIVPTTLIAQGVLALYYPQWRPYVANDGIARELRQISMKSSPSAPSGPASASRRRHAGCHSVDGAATRVADVYDEVLTEGRDDLSEIPGLASPRCLAGVDRPTDA